MKVLTNQDLANYYSKYEIFNGDKIDHFEKPDRIGIIIEKLKGLDHEILEIDSKVDEEILFQVHSEDYIEFLQRMSSSVEENVLRYPSVFRFEKGSKFKSDVAELGYYIFDTYTPMFKNTYDYASKSAGLAYEGAKLLGESKERVLYALCRPPGHHAESDRAGGYCYLNNSAIAAEYLSEFGKVALLDVDFHHGNGAQEIFYSDPNVLAVSIHADPNVKFPYFRGFEDEKGEGEGLGFNINYPLPLGTGNSEYSAILEKSIQEVANFAPKYLVVSFGTDTHEADPVGGFKLTTDYYKQMAERIASLRLPTLIIQEGGYNLSTIGEIVANFLSSFVNN